MVASTPETHSLTIVSTYSLYGILLILLVVVLQLVTARTGGHDDRPILPPLSSESKRRIQHGTTGILLVLISYCIPIHACIVLLTVATYLIYHLKTYHFHTIYLQNFGPLLRDYEKQPVVPSPPQSDNHHSDLSASRGIPLPGAYYFLCGTTITAMLFPLGIARYSVMCLSLADPMAAYIGQLVPSYRLDQIWFFNLLLRSIGITTNASVSGCIACFTTAWTIGYIQLVLLNDNMSDSFVYPIITVTAGAMACCIAEAIPFFGSHGNDNLQIPIFTALVVTISSWL